MRFGVLSTFPPTPCGVARFGAGLSSALGAHGSAVGVVRVADDSPPSGGQVVAELVNGSARSVAACADTLNLHDVAVIQHEFGIYGGADGVEVLDILEALRVPSIVVAHTVLENPTPHQRHVFETVTAKADRVVVMSDVARKRLSATYAVDRNKVATIPHGATLPTAPRVKRASRPTILTWGLLGPGKGIERVIDAMASLQDVPGRPRYVVAGRTHPKVLAAEGEAYRESLVERARLAGVADSVTFDAQYYGGAMLAALIQSSSVIVVPYDSTEQATSGVLVDAIASGRPVVATAFPHAIELLCGGAGLVVSHDDPDAMRTALRQVLTQPRLAGSMAAEARQLAPEMEWSVVADAYVQLAQRVLAERRTQ
ncbi:D-inositol-3-phosphate glycosyltransferase [Mycolicibacterium vanbaalenii]|uniref:D-inositol-3-phosphate glycosyltransferase n=1 Tax=Mycolicibacterium vanbaalenii TaxID=110539 RepID=A0A5S9RBE9_MYCVN|nr:glycosyltransferase [Mycolicibacterium vanbaalenii]CAA0138133.1 D-inositol-3-phosphate glycosyltransferase [Mycolicibacterium vanbaalenii]